MKNLLDSSGYKKIIQRISSLQTDNKRRWGKMNIEQMLAHCTDQIRLALGEKEATEKAGWFKHYVTLPIGLILPRLPRLKFRAPRDMNSAIGEGTKPTTLENDRRLLVEAIKRYHNTPTDFHPQPHPTFGVMNRKQWGKFMYLHIDHHLRQFSA
ncbi:MAG: DUF1569 domain-containing protein [Chitinophagales bacterium]